MSVTKFHLYKEYQIDWHAASLRSRAVAQWSFCVAAEAASYNFLACRSSASLAPAQRALSSVMSQASALKHQAISHLH